MKRIATVLGAAALLSGCGTVVDVLTKTGQVLMDPGVQVGAAEDQRTQVALSLHAARDVNPNPVSRPGNEFTPGEALEEGPFSVSLRGDSREELVDSLSELLENLQRRDGAASSVVRHARDPATARDRGLEGLPPSYVFRRGLESSASRGMATHKAPFPPHWRVRQGDAAQSEGLGADYAAEQEASGMALGQYRQGVALAAAAAPEPAVVVGATPVAFRVIQLKDDSLLEHADPVLLRNDPEKALRSTYLTADEYLLVPGQFKFINYRDLHEETRFIAVVATFHDPNARRWYDVFRVEPRGRRYALLVTLRDTRVVITDESYRPEQASRSIPINAR